MKKVLAITFVILFGLANFSFAEVKIGYVDLGVLFDQYKKTEDYDKVLQKKQEDYEKERDKKIAAIKKLQDKLSILNEKEKKKYQSEIEEKGKALKDFDRTKTTDLKKERDERIKEILKDIENEVKILAEKKKYSIVLNDRVLIYGDKALDLTNEALKSLNRKYKK